VRDFVAIRLNSLRTVSVAYSADNLFGPIQVTAGQDDLPGRHWGPVAVATRSSW